ncbi:MAG: class I SAM-dependent methyltransferase [archaeon]
MDEDITQTTNTNFDLIDQFYILADYLKQRGLIKDAGVYKNDVSTFLLHVSHLKSYEFVQSFCKGKSVLDVGCNIGYGANILSQVSKEVIAIDFDSKALDFARDRFATHNIKFQHSEAQTLPYPDGSFDIVTSFQVIEHIKQSDIPLYINEIKRVLTGNGIAILTTPNRKLRLNPFEKPWNPEHFTEYSAKGLRKKLTKFFTRVEILGLRAEKWIEDVERDRIHKSFFKSYVVRPTKCILRLILPSLMNRLKAQNLASISEPSSTNADKVLKIEKKVSMTSFRFESDSLDRSLCLLTICRK